MARANQLLGNFDRASWERDIAETAVGFAASRFQGAGAYETFEAATIPEAEAEVAKRGGLNRWMIYAVDANGHRTLVMSRGKPVRPGA